MELAMRQVLFQARHGLSIWEAQDAFPNQAINAVARASSGYFAAEAGIAAGRGALWRRRFGGLAARPPGPKRGAGAGAQRRPSAPRIARRGSGRRYRVLPRT